MLSIVKAQPAAIVKAPRPAQSGVDPRELYIATMHLMFLRAPARPTREEVRRGAITDLGEVGSVQEKDWSRATAYSRAKTKHG
jgi:hypothetical protein